VRVTIHAILNKGFISILQICSEGLTTV